MATETIAVRFRRGKRSWTEILAAARDDLLPPLGPDAAGDVSIDVTRGGGRTRHTNLSDALSAWPAEADEFRLAAHASEGSLRVSRHAFEPLDLFDVEFRVDAGAAEAARAALDGFGERLGLARLAPDGLPPESNLQREYVWTGFNPKALDRAVRDCMGDLLVKPDLRIELTEETAGAARQTRSLRDLDGVPPMGDQLVRVGFSYRKSRGLMQDLHVDFEPERSNRMRVDLRYWHEADAEIRVALERFEQALDLKAWSDDLGRREFNGSRGDYFTTADVPLDFGWYCRLMTEVGELVPDSLHFALNVTWAGREGIEDSLGSQALATPALSENWQDVRFLRLWTEGSAYLVAAELEPLLDFVSLEVRHAEKAEADETRAELARRLSLDPVFASPYRTPRTEKTWDIGHLDRERLARTVAAIVGAKPERSPLLYDSYLMQTSSAGGVERQNYHELDDMLKAMGDGPGFSAAHLVVKKPKGETLSFHVTDGLRQLTVRSSYDPDRFADVRRTLEKRLDLQEPGSSTPAAQRRSFAGQVLHLEGLPGKMAALALAGLAAVGGFLLDRIVPDIEIEMTAPRMTGATPDSYAAGCLDVIWTVRRDRWLSEQATTLDATGTVNLLRADGTISVELQGHRSRDPVHVPPGTWDIFVFDPELGRRSNIVRFEALEKDYDQRLGVIEEDCGRFGG